MRLKIVYFIIIVCYVISLNPYITLCVLPIYSVCCIVFFYYSNNMKKSIVVTLFPILLWYPGTVIFYKIYFWYAEKTRPKYDFVFAADFEGYALIVENQSCGIDEVKIGDRNVIEFPSNGIVLYKTELGATLVPYNYYIQSSPGKIEIPVCVEHNGNVESGKKCARFSYSGVNPRYQYYVFEVGNVDSSEIALKSLFNQVDDIITDCNAHK